MAAAVAFLLIAGGRDGALPSLTPIAEAAERTAQYPGARIKLSARFDIAGSDLVLKMHGGGQFNGKAGHSRLTAAVDDLPPEAYWRTPDGNFEIEQVGVERPGTVVLYMRSPAMGTLPGGTEWLKLDFSEDIDTQSQSFDPRRQLRVLATSHDLENLGTERVRGVRTTHYTATIDQSAEVERLREEGKARATETLETVIAANDGDDISQVEAWVGPDRTIHRYRMTMPFSLTAPQGSTLQMTVDLFDFGVEPDIALPDESDVFDGTEMAREELERLAK